LFIFYLTTTTVRAITDANKWHQR
jgi:hypothetical protein